MFLCYDGMTWMKYKKYLFSIIPFVDIDTPKYVKLKKTSSTNGMRNHSAVVLVLIH